MRKRYIMSLNYKMRKLYKMCKRYIMSYEMR